MILTVAEAAAIICPCTKPNRRLNIPICIPVSLYDINWSKRYIRPRHQCVLNGRLVNSYFKMRLFQSRKPLVTAAIINRRGIFCAAMKTCKHISIRQVHCKMKNYSADDSMKIINESAIRLELNSDLIELYQILPQKQSY